MKLENDISRIIGQYSSGKSGPLLFISGGIHGNEPSGIIAMQRVFDILNELQPEINGVVFGVAGNLEALKKGVRFIDEDLNRAWTEENIKKHITDSSEKQEMFDIINMLEKFPPEQYNKRYFLDCHTTSSDSLPYISVQNVNDNYSWADQFPTNIIRGFSDIVYGCIDHYLSRIGVNGFVFEGGQHADKTSVLNHEGIIWLAIKNACGLEFNQLKNSPKAVKHLNEMKSQQKTFEIIYRHGLEKDDTFVMEDGYKNFQKIEQGEVLARHNNQEVTSKWDAYIFMPLYQAQGNDGFFVIQEV